MRPKRPLKCQECRGSFYWDPDKTLHGDKPRKCPRCSNSGKKHTEARHL